MCLLRNWNRPGVVNVRSQSVGRRAEKRREANLQVRGEYSLDAIFPSFSNMACQFIALNQKP